MLAAAIGLGFFSLMDACMKSASLVVGAYSAVLLRSLMAAFLAGGAWLVRGGQWPARRVLKVHVLRGMVISLTALTFFAALERLPMAEAIALSFISPLIALALAALVLGERVGKSALWAGLLGLGGVLVIVAGRIGHHRLGHAAATGIGLVLISALFYAWNLVLQRQQALLARPLEIVAFQSMVVTLVLLPAAPFFLTLPSATVGATILVACLLSITAGLILAWAYARAEAQVLVPIEYTGFAWASLFGWLFFAERVSAATFAGAALIILACLIAAPRRKVEQTAV